MQALHCKLDVVLVQILPYNSSETDYSFCPFLHYFFAAQIHRISDRIRVRIGIRCTTSLAPISHL